MIFDFNLPMWCIYVLVRNMTDLGTGCHSSASLLLYYSSFTLPTYFSRKNDRVVLCVKCAITYSYLSYFKTFMSLMSKLYIYRDLKFDQKNLADAVTCALRIIHFLLSHLTHLHICNGRFPLYNLNINPLSPHHLRPII